ncbi:MAG: wax ester/triacylglycerol synthase family O-acyltransferase [Deltaproteobacteria bacterium]|nr:MAG: wax ester/triacylglycerol synthase family O-acyltransferase [Deltaproteobacteria bacterium]TMB31757.1 MAG: wax ester/triacylglycerol synthase family O-acyltransferase [Deltaproteobacteria bacterium]TMB33152.1 MAG: wax ester/triacylglycerol synthase family O-acyltransferase [Deltaproteobacteria bacterium]
MPTTYDRLNHLDRSFLVYESGVSPMHVGGTATFEVGGLRRPEGGLDIGRIRALIEARLPLIPRYRQVVATTPLGAPIWVDDAHFNLEYHVRHTSLPSPGDDRQLKALSARVFSQALDRAKPLWELWFVEGVAGGDRFALISKVHHAMVDGISAVDLLQVILSPDQVAEVGPAPRWLPRPAPSARKLAFDDLRSFVRAPLGLAARAPALLAEARKPGSDLRAALRGATDLAFKTVRRPSETPFNRPIGPHRRCDWLALDLGEVKAVRHALGGSLNDVVLATVTGAVSRFLAHRSVRADGLDFRVMTPVSVRTPDERGALGNRVSAWTVPLPVGEPDPRRRLALIQETTGRLKQEKNALGAEMLTRMAGWAPATLLSLGARLAWRNLPFNLIVTNVPGPQHPLYLLASRMLDNYGLLPLADYLGLAIVLMSYDGKLCWGFTADWDLVPDVGEFARCIEEAFGELRRLAA